MVNIRKTKSALRFENPAGWWGSTWREALPAGNGVIGAAVYGGAGNETIMINHGDLSWQGHISVLPDVADKLKDVREKLEDNKPRDAQSIYEKAMVSKNYRPQVAVPLPLCDFNIKTLLDRAPRDYMRVLNMENGEISVVYRDGNTKFDRSLFVSRDNDCIIYEINKSGSKPIDAEFSFSLHDRIYNRTPAAPSKLPESVMTKYEPYFMYFSAASDNGTEFGAVAKIAFYNGSQEVTPNSIKIKGATSVLVIIKLFIESQREKEWKRLRTEIAAIKDNYDKMLKSHTAIHSRLLNSMELDLDAPDRDATVESLLRRAQNGEMTPALIEKMWMFARYLLVSSTRPEGRPVTPYGLWCGDYKAVSPVLTADCDFHSIYGQALSGNLADLLMPIFNYYENVVDDLKKNAMRLYGARGIFVPVINSPGTGLPGSCDPAVTFFTAGAAVVSNLFYNYALFTDDAKFMKARALPFMKDAALFYEDFLKLGHNGMYVASPSYSPGTNPGNYNIEGEDTRLDIAVNSTVDFAAARELFQNLIAGGNAANMYKNEIPKWEDMLTKFPPYEINSDRAVKEYIGNKYTDNYASEKAPHLYAAYPGTEINTQSDSEMVKAFSAAAKKRLTAGLREQTSSSLGALGSALARLGDTDGAMDCLEIMTRSSVMNNLVTARNDWRGMGISSGTQWAPYHIQGNMIFAGVVQDMLIGSTANSIKIFPALPSGWEKIEAAGILTRAGIEVSVNYTAKNNTLLLTLKAKRSTKVDLYFPAGTKKLAKGVGIENFNAEELSLKGIEIGSKPVVFDIKYAPVNKR